MVRRRNKLITNASQMKCGACGGDTFKVFEQRGTKTTSLIIECCKCLSTSIIRASQPNIEIGWGPKSDGILAVFGKEEG